MFLHFGMVKDASPPGLVFSSRRGIVGSSATHPLSFQVVGEGPAVDALVVVGISEDDILVLSSESSLSCVTMQ